MKAHAQRDRMANRFGDQAVAEMEAILVGEFSPASSDLGMGDAVGGSGTFLQRSSSDLPPWRPLPPFTFPVPVLADTDAS